MTSAPSDLLKFEKQTTGENSGTWGTKANTAMSRIEEAIAGMTEITLAGSNYTLDDTQYVENTSTTAESHLMIIKASGTPGATRQIIVPLRTKVYLVWNATDASDLTVGGSSGDTVTVENGTLSWVFCDGTNVEHAGVPFTTGGAHGGTFLSNLVEDTTPQLGGDLDLNAKGIDDSNGNEMFLFTETAGAVNELLWKNEATGSNPGATASGDDTNVGIDFIPKGTGNLEENGVAVGLTGKQTIWVPAAAMRPTSSNGCAALTDVETTAGNPDMQVLDFDATSDEHAQFQIFFPKSWDESTVTFRAVWTTTATDTDGVTWGLQGVAVGDGDTIDASYGTAVTVDDAGQSTAEDLYLTDESTAITIAGSPAVDQLCYFRVFRDVSDTNDDMTEDARLMGIRIIFSTDTGNDA